MGFFTKLIAGTLQGTVGTAVGLAKDVVTGFGIGTGEGPESINQLSGGVGKVLESVEDLSDGDLF